MTRAVLLALALGASVLSGCMSAELARVHRDVGTELPGLQSGHAFQMGRLTMALGRAFAGDDEQARVALGAVRGVAVGTYALRGSTEARVLPGLGARLGRRGWQPFVVTREDGDAAFVYVRTRGDELRDLLVVSIEDDEMTLVRVHGRFSEATLAALMQDDGFGVDIGPALARVRAIEPPTGG